VAGGISWRTGAESAWARLAPALPVLRAVGFVAAVGVVVAMAVVAAREVPAGQLDWWLLAPAVAAAGVWWLLLARGWSLLVAGDVTRRDLSLWFRTQTLRYLPGGLWAPASRLTLVRGGAVARIGTVAAENVVSLCAALAIGGAALVLDGRPLWGALVLVAAAPVLAARLTPRARDVHAERVARATANGLAAFAAYVVSAVLVQAAISGWQQPFEVAGSAAIAWAVGLVAVFAPGGVGVRELVYVALVAGTIAKGDAAAAAVTMRLVTVVAELAVLLAAGRPVAHRSPTVDGAS
jgi:glycosyltransferase 2 family protein